MNAKELADKFNAKTRAAVVERERQSDLAVEHIQKRGEDIEHCKRAMESNVLPFLAEPKHLRPRSTYRITSQYDLRKTLRLPPVADLKRGLEVLRRELALHQRCGCEGAGTMTTGAASVALFVCRP
jgi:hypothetical protein